MRRVSGVKGFRLNIILAILKGERLQIKDIRVTATDPGLRDHEVRFLRLVSEITQGTVVEINDAGTDLTLTPGIVSGGQLEFDCGGQYGIVYFLEPLLLLLPFAKSLSKIMFSGLTASEYDVSIDGLKYFYEPFLDLIQLRDLISIKVESRGFPPDGVGRVQLQVAPVDRITNITLTGLFDSQPTKRVRGLLASCKVNSQIINNLIGSIKDTLSEYYSDVYIYADTGKGSSSTSHVSSPGLGLALVGVSDDHVKRLGITADLDSVKCPDFTSLSKTLAKTFLLKSARNEQISSEHLWLILGLMTVASGVSTIEISERVARAAEQDGLFAQVQEAAGVQFSVRGGKGTGSHGFVVVKCLGTGLGNIAKEFK